MARDQGPARVLLLGFAAPCRGFICNGGPSESGGPAPAAKNRHQVQSLCGTPVVGPAMPQPSADGSRLQYTAFPFGGGARVTVSSSSVMRRIAEDESYYRLTSVADCVIMVPEHSR